MGKRLRLSKYIESSEENLPVVRSELRRTKMSDHKARVSRELKMGRVKAFIGNFIILAYTVFLVASLGRHLEFWETFSSSAWYLSLAVCLPLAFIYSLSSQSLGNLLIRHSNKLLKQNVEDSGSRVVRRFTQYFSVVLVGLTLVLGFILTDSSFEALLSSEGVLGAQRIFSAMMHPELSIIGSVLEAMVQTIFIALIATVLSVPIAFLTGFLCARNLMKSSGWSLSIYHFLRFIFNFTRSVEPMIWAIIFSVWVGIGPFAGMLALMLHSVAALAKNYSEQVECIDQGPLEAIEATGADRIQVIWYGVVPQVVLPFLAFTIYRWDINVRMATIIGLVGGGGIGTLLMQYQGLARWNEVGTIILVIAAVVWVMDYLSAKIREAIY